jgi:hypothetical protein
VVVWPQLAGREVLTSLSRAQFVKEELHARCSAGDLPRCWNSSICYLGQAIAAWRFGKTNG